MPLLPSALPPKGEARRYIANNFLNLIALPFPSERDFRSLASYFLWLFPQYDAKVFISCCPIELFLRGRIHQIIDGI